MNKHTAGPWRKGESVSYGGDAHGFPIYFNDDGEQVVDYVYTEADADLICASPDLLDAAQNAIEAWGKFLSSFDYIPGIGDTAENMEFREMQALRNAIAKARGDE